MDILDSGGGPSNGEESEDLNIPRAAINKMIKDTVPNFRVANDARDLITNCCTEFIRLIATQANEACEREQKRTITPDHLLTALDNVGFQDYKADIIDVYRDCKEVVAKRRNKNNRLENCGISEEELLRQQQELFARAREAEMVTDEAQWKLTQDALMLRHQQEMEENPNSGNDVDSDDDYDT